jgi:hypothetical protein
MLCFYQLITADKSKPMKIILLISLLLVASSVSAQSTKCTLDSTQAPAIRGFKLGMNKQSAEETFGSKINIYHVDERDDTAAMSVASYEYPDKLKNVTNISMNFFDDRMIKIMITYAVGAFANHTEAQSRLNREWNLPNAWSAVKYGDAFLVCNGWTMTLRLLGGQPQVELGVQGIDKKIAERVKQKAAGKFKP